MNLSETVKVNRQIMGLIKSKYPDVFPLGYHNLDARYYNLLDKEIEEVERSLTVFDKKDPADES